MPMSDVLPAVFFLGPRNMFYDARSTATESVGVERQYLVAATPPNHRMEHAGSVDGSSTTTVLPSVYCPLPPYIRVPPPRVSLLGSHCPTGHAARAHSVLCLGDKNSSVFLL